MSEEIMTILQEPVKSFREKVRTGLAQTYSIPVLVLDLRPEARKKIVEVIRVATGMAINTGEGWTKNTKPYEHIARAVLSALAGEKGKR